MLKSKSKILTFFTVLVILFCFTLPTYAISYKGSFSFEMSKRVVHGGKNGEFYTLEAGKWTSISGTQRVKSSEPNAVGPFTLNYELFRDDFWFDPSFGSVQVNFNKSSLNYSTYFDRYFPKKPDKTSSKYYLFIFRNDFDGHTVTGNGSLWQD